MRSSLPLKLTFLLSLTLAGGAASLSEVVPLSFPTKPRAKSSLSYATIPKAEANKAKTSFSDLLSLLGPPQLADAVNPLIASQLWSCFKFLSPCNEILTARTTNLNVSPDRSGKDIDELILSPPASVLELARLAVDSGGDPGAIHRALDPTIIRVPDIEGSNEHQCELTRTPYGRLFIDEALNSYLEFLFQIIVERGPNVGLNVALSRFDLFHGHLFIARESGRLGILFHAKEYPAYDKELFPCNMGYCQIGSNVTYDDSMNLRNILWLAPLPSNSTNAWLAPGVLVVLDANPEGIIFRDLIPEYVQLARTLYEEYFGEVVVDVNYLNVGGQAPEFKIFIC